MNWFVVASKDSENRITFDNNLWSITKCGEKVTLSILRIVPTELCLIAIYGS